MYLKWIFRKRTIQYYWRQFEYAINVINILIQVLYKKEYSFKIEVDTVSLKKDLYSLL